MAKVVRINDNTRDVQKTIRGLSGDAMDDFADKAVDIIKSTAPVRAVRGGNHRSKIAHKIFGPLKRKAQIFSASNYGAYLEFGTSKMAARPHFRPGIQQAVKEFQDPTRWNK